VQGERNTVVVLRLIYYKLISFRTLFSVSYYSLGIYLQSHFPLHCIYIIYMYTLFFFLLRTICTLFFFVYIYIPIVSHIFINIFFSRHSLTTMTNTIQYIYIYILQLQGPTIPYRYKNFSKLCHFV